MAGPVSPKAFDKSFDNLVFSNLSSPRFDISDFLKTPTDGSPKEEEDDSSIYNSFQGFTVPGPPFLGSESSSVPSSGGGNGNASASTLHHDVLHPQSLPGLPSGFLNHSLGVSGSLLDPSSATLSCPAPDFGAPLLQFDEDCKASQFGMDNVLSNCDIVPFDDYIDGILDGSDSFSVFNDANYDTTVVPNPSANMGYVPFVSNENGMMMPPLTAAPPNMYVPSDTYLGPETSGLLEIGDHMLVGLDHGASSSIPPNAMLYPNNQLDWAVPSQGIPFASNFGQQGTLQCEGCQILRRIIHSNGVQDTKLEIHGRQGQSYHAVLQTRFCIDDGFPSTLEQQMVDFPVGNSEYVKQFLLQYSMLRSKEGFILRHDSLQVPIDLSCIVPERVMGGVNAQMFPQAGFSTGQNKMTHGNCSTENADGSVAPVKPPKSNAAAQRERTGKLKMSDLAQFFHLPINAAAKELGICPTVLKKICRRNGMRRWPHRKIKSIERIIATLEQTIAEGAGQGDESIRMEIAMLRNERAQLCAGLLGEK